MSESDYKLRYSRQLVLPDFGATGQEALRRASVLIVGLGGLGSPAALYLAAAGVGSLLLNDFDRVDLSNLQRQILFSSAQVGTAKTSSAADTLQALNPECKLQLFEQRLQGPELASRVRQADVVLDGSDNFGTRFAVNAACAQTRTPLVSGAAIRYEGQIGVFDVRDDGSACYACLYPEAGDELENCQSNGILAPVVGIIGSHMALEAIKLISGVGTPLTGRLLRLNAKNGTFSVSNIKRDPGCPVCRSR